MSVQKGATSSYLLPAKKMLLPALFCMLVSAASGQLRSSFYDTNCPYLHQAVWKVVSAAVRNDSRIGASLLRLQFHDCFVNGCDGSILLDDTASFKGEKGAVPNKNSARGFEVIDAVKSLLETKCPGVVSCADIVALAAQASVAALGGPTWLVLLGRRDSTTASLDDANKLPAPSSDIQKLISAFQGQGLSVQDLVALSGAHTVGKAQCLQFRDRLYNFRGTSSPDSTIEASFLASLQENCPKSSGDSQLSNLDVVTPIRFDNQFYKNLQSNKGLLSSDQVLISGNSSESIALVNKYAGDARAFFNDFRTAMVNMGNISPLTGNAGEIRKNCRAVNS